MGRISDKQRKRIPPDDPQSLQGIYTSEELEASRKVFAEWWKEFDAMSPGDPHFYWLVKRIWK